MRCFAFLHMSNEPLKHSQTIDFYIRFIFWLYIILSFQYQVIDYINVHLSRIMTYNEQTHNENHFTARSELVCVTCQYKDVIS